MESILQRFKEPSFSVQGLLMHEMQTLETDAMWQQGKNVYTKNKQTVLGQKKKKMSETHFHCTITHNLRYD